MGSRGNANTGTEDEKYRQALLRSFSVKKRKERKGKGKKKKGKERREEERTEQKRTEKRKKRDMGYS